MALSPSVYNNCKYDALLQGGREISAIILADDYLYYKEPKIPLNLFCILIFNEYLSLKLRTNGNIERRGPLLCT